MRKYNKLKEAIDQSPFYKYVKKNICIKFKEEELYGILDIPCEILKKEADENGYSEIINWFNYSEAQNAIKNLLNNEVEMKNALNNKYTNKQIRNFKFSEITYFNFKENYTIEFKAKIKLKES